MFTQSKARLLWSAFAALGCLAFAFVTLAAGGTGNGPEALVRSYIEVWNTGNMQKADAVLAEEFTRKGPAPIYTALDREDMKRQIADTRSSYEDFTVTIDALKSEGDRAVLSWSVRGKHNGTQYPQAAGRRIDISGTSAYRVVGAKIAHEDISWDYVKGYEQLGITDPVLDESASNKEIALAFTTELYEKGNMAAANELVSDDFVFHVPGEKRAVIGPQGAQKRAAIFRTAFPDLKFTTMDVIASDDLVAARWTFSGTHRGTFLGHEQTGKKVAVSGLSMSRVKDGKIVEAWGAWDRGDLMEQLSK